MTVLWSGMLIRYVRGRYTHNMGDPKYLSTWLPFWKFVSLLACIFNEGFVLFEASHISQRKGGDKDSTGALCRCAPFLLT